MQNQNQIEKIEEMLNRDIKPTEAVSGTQAYGEVGVEFEEADSTATRVTVFTDINSETPAVLTFPQRKPNHVHCKGTVGS